MTSVYTERSTPSAALTPTHHNSFRIIINLLIFKRFLQKRLTYPLTTHPFP